MVKISLLYPPQIRYTGAVSVFIELPQAERAFPTTGKGQAPEDLEQRGCETEGRRPLSPHHQKAAPPHFWAVWLEIISVILILRSSSKCVQTPIVNQIRSPLRTVMVDEAHSLA